MTRLQNFALYRLAYSIIWFAFVFFWLRSLHVSKQAAHMSNWYLVFLGICILLIIITKRYQKRHYPGLGARMDEMETLLELKSTKLASKSSGIYLLLGWSVLAMMSVNQGPEIFNLFTTGCLTFSIFPVHELLHWCGVRYYTVNEDALKKPDYLVR